MSRGIVEQIADAVLYEGYLLYPYRASALKNRQRWYFGGLCPQSYSEIQAGSEVSKFKTECLTLANDEASFSVKIRFLQLVNRQAARISRRVTHLDECSDADFHFVDILEIGDRFFQTWQEANEREIEIPEFRLGENRSEPLQFDFHLPESREVESLRDSEGKIAGVLIRTQNPLDGKVQIEVEQLASSLFKLTLHVLNTTPFTATSKTSREQAMTHSLVSCHAILNVRKGEFISLLDPPAQYSDYVPKCENLGVYPVLVGEVGECSVMLSSPVILYDYPKVAPESAGDLYDGAEIDEILTLRILTLTEQEKSEMRQCDERARKILERVESDPEHLARLHGAMRSVDAASEERR